MDLMKKDQGPIVLVVRSGHRTTKAILAILNRAECVVGEPGESTLRLVGYEEGNAHADIAMIQYTEPGMRVRYLEALMKVGGVDAAG